MGKKKNKKVAKSKANSNSNGKRKRSDSGAAEIAKAEKKLERTLHKLDDVRAELAEREAALRDVLIKFGRMPAVEPSPPSAPPVEALELTHPLDGLGDGALEGSDDVISVPLLDQRQILDVGFRDPAEREE